MPKIKDVKRYYEEKCEEFPGQELVIHDKISIELIDSIYLIKTPKDEVEEIKKMLYENYDKKTKKAKERTDKLFEEMRKKVERTLKEEDKLIKKYKKKLTIVNNIDELIHKLPKDRVYLSKNKRKHLDLKSKPFLINIDQENTGMCPYRYKSSEKRSPLYFHKTIAKIANVPDKYLMSSDKIINYIEKKKLNYNLYLDREKQNFDIINTLNNGDMIYNNEYSCIIL